VLQCVESVKSELHAEGRGVEYHWSDHYGVAVISRLLKIIGLFCRISSLL